MGAHTDDTRAFAGFRAGLTGFAVEIDATLRPTHPAGASSKRPCAADILFEPVEQRLEGNQMVAPFVIHGSMYLFTLCAIARMRGKDETLLAREAAYAAASRSAGCCRLR